MRAGSHEKQASRLSFENLFTLENMNLQNSSEKAAFHTCGLAQSPSVRAGSFKKRPSRSRKTQAYSQRIQQVSKLEPEHRFLNEPARTESICKSRLAQKTSFWLEEGKGAESLFVRFGKGQGPNDTSRTRTASPRPLARTHARHETKRNEADFPVGRRL